jgi:hypothetical protein
VAVTPTRPAAVLDQARRLHEVLEALAAALGRGDASAVLASEPALQAVVEAVGRADTLAAEERAATVDELQRARRALARCRAIGAAAADLARATVDVLGGTGCYSRRGAGRPRAARGRDLHARV